MLSLVLLYQVDSGTMMALNHEIFAARASSTSMLGAARVGATSRPGGESTPSPAIRSAPSGSAATRFVWTISAARQNLRLNDGSMVGSHHLLDGERPGLRIPEKYLPR
jgi:hypothetical protein